MADAFPGWEVRPAFNSGMVRRKLKKRATPHIDSVVDALARLRKEGLAAALCQPTRILGEMEYGDIVADAAPFWEACYHLDPTRPCW